MSQTAMAMTMGSLIESKAKNVALVIDDDEYTRLLLQRALRHHFDSVLLVENGAEAEALCETCPITHVVVDYDLGEEMNGPQVVQRLKAIRPGIARVVLCSGSQFDPTTLPGCIDGFVRKGNGLRGLMAALRG